MCVYIYIYFFFFLLVNLLKHEKYNSKTKKTGKLADSIKYVKICRLSWKFLCFYKINFHFTEAIILHFQNYHIYSFHWIYQFRLFMVRNTVISYHCHDPRFNISSLTDRCFWWTRLNFEFLKILSKMTMNSCRKRVRLLYLHL